MGRGQGGLARAFPQWAAVTDAKQRPGKQSAKPTQPPACYLRNPKGWGHLSIFVALLARARPLRVSPSTSAFKNQQMVFSGLHGI